MFHKNASARFKRHAFGILVVGCLAMYFSCCISTDVMNVLQPVFTELGWSYSQLSMPMTIMGYLLVAGSFLLSTIIIKNGTRVFGVAAFGCMAAGTLLVAAAYASDSYLLYFIGGMTGRLGCTATQMFIFQLCAEWFDETRGRVLGIVTMAAPLNSATSTSLLTMGYNRFGFTATYLAFGFVLVASTVLACFFSQSRPSDMGMTVDGIEAQNRPRETEQSKAVLSMKQILTHPSTWKLIVSFGIFNGAIAGVMAFFITRMTAVGVEQSFALVLLSAASLIGIPLSYVYGWLDDKFGTIRADVVLGIMYVVMCVCLLVGTSAAMPLIVFAAVGMASMTAGCPNLHPSSIMYVFGAGEYQNANRYIGIGISLISACGVQLMSTCLDLTGSLNAGYIILAVLSAIATVCIALTKKVTLTSAQ